ncbi:Flp pilus assembly protein CpaB [Caballeronia sp. GAFFF2]|jgi:pilus assembly protein CpaB|uniref:Flp pilus assembly protein CpaB n=1 Tax=Caballeronia sp. GAFFF2 TaxID=2921741 RepID=UPI0020285F1D|nr:Flp pilus assembly protein CpaB [Caballeronia sp. GAFFF2]
MANVSRIIAIALFALAALLGLYAVTLTRAAPASRAPLVMPAGSPAVTVIVAAHDLLPGKALTADDLTMQAQAVLPTDAFSSASILLGRVPVVRVPAGSALTDGVLAGGLTAAIEPGERAIAIRVDESNAVNNLVKPGDAVDVFVVLKRDSVTDGEIPASHARLLLSKVRVLGFGDSVIANDAATNAANATNATNHATAARTAVLGVRVDDIDTLTLAENSGRLLLALRNPADTASTDSQARNASAQSPIARAAAGVSLATLSGGTSRPAPPASAMLAGAPMLPPLPAALATGGAVASRKVASASGIEVIRGSHSETVSNP